MGEWQDDAGRELLTLPELCLVGMVGTTAEATRRFATRAFAPGEVLALPDTPTDDPLRAIADEVGARLRRWRLTVVDAGVRAPSVLWPLVSLAHAHNVQPVAILLNVAAADGTRLVTKDRLMLRELAREGFPYIHVLSEREVLERIQVERALVPPDRRDMTGPFDIIGDVHGCLDELRELLDLLGYLPDPDGVMRHPEGRRAVYLGDLVDRGPDVIGTVNLVRRMVEAGTALCVPGNHDDKLLRYLKGHPVRISHGLEDSVAQLRALPPEERAVWAERYRVFQEGLASHLVLDGWRLVVAHAGMKEHLQGRVSRRVRDFALYGETTGLVDEFGLPIRGNWAAKYHGPATVVYGHTAIREPSWLNNTVDIDTGCVYGGRLTALRWPERGLVSVPAHRVYFASPRKLE